MLWIVLYVTLAVVESGDWSAIIKAQQLFHEVYGKKIEAAKTPQAKAALAKELLELAKKETDQDIARLAYENAKSLACKSSNASLAVQVVRDYVLAHRAETEVSPEIADRAESLWLDAEKQKPSEKLALQIDAVELWFQSGVSDPLLSAKWYRRMAELTGVIVCEPKDAIRIGPVNYVAHLDSLGDWIDPTAFVEWKTWLPAGSYAVHIVYAHGYAKSSGIMAVTVLSIDKGKTVKSFPFEVTPTGQGFNFVPFHIGTLRVAQSNDYLVRVHVLSKSNDAVHMLQLQSVRFTRQAPSR